LMTFFGNWTIAIKEFDNVNLLQDEFDKDDVNCVLQGSQGTVFYIAGYLLRSVSKAKTEKNRKSRSTNLSYTIIMTRILHVAHYRHM
jgi:hypothetical protein